MNVNDANSNMTAISGPISTEQQTKSKPGINTKVHNDYRIVVSGNWCLENMFSLQEMDSSQPYQVSPRTVAYALYEPLKQEVDKLQKQQLIVPLGLDETSEWCNSFFFCS